MLKTTPLATLVCCSLAVGCSTAPPLARPDDISPALQPARANRNCRTPGEAAAVTGIVWVIGNPQMIPGAIIELFWMPGVPVDAAVSSPFATAVTNASGCYAIPLPDPSDPTFVHPDRFEVMVHKEGYETAT